MLYENHLRAIWLRSALEKFDKEKYLITVSESNNYGYMVVVSSDSQAWYGTDLAIVCCFFIIHVIGFYQPLN